MEPSQNSFTQSLYDELDDNLAECPLTHNKFLPLNALNDLITVESVLVNIDSGNTIVGTQYSLSDKGLAQEVVLRAKKGFASLVFVGHQRAIRDLLSEGFTDEYLPLSRTRSGVDRNLLSGCDGSKTFGTFRTWRSAHVDNFLEKQWRVQAPVFDTSSCHFNLNRHCALPLHRDFDHIEVSAYSDVFKCEVYRAHHQHRSQARAGQLQVAIKKLHNQKMFEREKENLTGIQNLNNRHLIKHIATCQQNTDYYVVFPFANGGNLLEYWEREIEIPRSLDLIMWSLQQMLGLAGALYTLHHDLGADIHCRHGDIKPANILLFEKGDDRILVLADLGVSRFHEERTHMRRGGTTTMATTLSYEAPEVLELGNKDKPRARTYDIWSLGCVFLEFVIFLLYDFKAVKNFEDNRKRTTTCDNPNASFFQTTSNGHAEILPEVFDAIEALREDPRCRGGTSLNVLVNLIADKLLVTVVENRWRAEQLHEELQKIVHKANQDRSYLLNTTDQSPPVPKVFLPVGAQASRTW